MTDPNSRKSQPSYVLPAYGPEISLVRGDIFATIDIVESNSGFSTEWWVSRTSKDYAQALAFLSFPVFGYDRPMAHRRVEQIGDDVISFVEHVSGGISSPSYSSRKPLHVSAHLHTYLAELEETDVVKQTQLLYDYLSTFRVANPARIIASVLKVDNIRTIHDRIERARERGILARPGQGKTY